MFFWTGLILMLSGVTGAQLMLSGKPTLFFFVSTWLVISGGTLGFWLMAIPKGKLAPFFSSLFGRRVDSSSKAMTANILMRTSRISIVLGVISLVIGGTDSLNNMAFPSQIGAGFAAALIGLFCGLLLSVVWTALATRIEQDR